VLNAYGKKLLVSAVLAIVIVLGLAFSALLAPSLISPTTTPEATPIPTPKPTVTPTLGPRPKLDLRAGFTSLEGFNLTEMQFQTHPSSPYPVLVLRPGESGSIPITLISTDDRDYTVSLEIGLAAVPGKFEGVRYVFSPAALNLKAEAEVNSILSIEADSDAPTAYYEFLIYAHVKEWGGRMIISDFGLLIYPYTPSYAYHLIAPTPGEPAPTPIITMPPLTIAVKPGGTVYVMFDIDKGTSDPTVQVKIDLTHNSGSLPSGISAKFISDPLMVVPAPTFESVIMLSLTAAEDTPEGTYRMIATISVGSYTFQIPFDLTVTSKQ